jgi:hypothetical protein
MTSRDRHSSGTTHSARNITAARDVGLAAEQWTFADGHATLLGLLAKHGVTSA